jgi:hypothetical protein
MHSLNFKLMLILIFWVVFDHLVYFFLYIIYFCDFLSLKEIKILLIILHIKNNILNKTNNQT